VHSLVDTVKQNNTQRGTVQLPAHREDQAELVTATLLARNVAASFTPQSSVVPSVYRGYERPIPRVTTALRHLQCTASGCHSGNLEAAEFCDKNNIQMPSIPGDRTKDFSVSTNDLSNSQIHFTQTETSTTYGLTVNRVMQRSKYVYNQM
jgi:hypothetical protein